MAGCYFRGFGAVSPVFLSLQTRPLTAPRRWSLRWGVQRAEGGLDQRLGSGPGCPVPTKLLRSFTGGRAGGFGEASACHEPAGLKASDSVQRGRVE